MYLHDQANFIYVFNILAEEAYKNACNKGFYELTDRVLSKFEGEDLKYVKNAFDAMRISLMHSELSEALEGMRKDLESDKIPGFTSVEEELADTIIRIFDLVGAQKLRVAEAVIAKMEYNANRPYMHGGKAF